MNRQGTAIGNGSRWLAGLGGVGRAVPRIIARSRDGNLPFPTVRVGSSPGVAGAHRPGQQYPEEGVRSIGRDVRTSVLHRSNSLKPVLPSRHSHCSEIRKRPFVLFNLIGKPLRGPSSKQMEPTLEHRRARYPCRRTPARDHDELQIADVRDHVVLSLFADFGNFSVFRPLPLHEKSFAAMLDQLVAWGGALRGLRSAAAHADRQ